METEKATGTRDKTEKPAGLSILKDNPEHDTTRQESGYSMKSMKSLTLMTCAILAAIIAGCATSPTGRPQMMLVSEAELAQMGSRAFTQMKDELDVSDDPGITRYVNCVADAIIQTIDTRYDWEVAVFDDDAINAFALPGGKIGIFTGLLRAAENQHQLAAVMGHEVAHVTARHSAARVSNQLATQMGVSVLAGATRMDPQLIGMGADLLLTLPYSRGDETEADILGLDYMARAGFDPRESKTLWLNMEKQQEGGRPPGFLSTHPAPQNRIRELEKHTPDALNLYEQARSAGRRPNCRR